MNEMQTEMSARVFAEATHAARDMLPLMTQEFEVRIKSNPEAHKQLKMCYFGKVYDPKENLAPLLGKTLTATVNWSALETANKYMFLTLSNGGSVLLDDENIKLIMTQKGLVSKMFTVWKMAAGK